MKLNFKSPLIWFVAGILLTGSAIQAKPQVDAETRKEMLELRQQKATIAAQERLLRLKTALKLRDEQMAAWNEYETYMLNEQQDRHGMMKQMQERRIENRTPPSSLELAEMNVQRLETQLAVARERLSAFTNLYSVLDEDQQQMVDKLSHQKIKNRAKELRKMRKDRN